MKPFTAKFARRPIQVSRDDSGVPRITGPTLDDCLYGLGYMHAVDRPTQMYFSRVVAAGRSAELISDKPELLETDRFFRRAGLYLNHERELALLDGEVHRQLDAYCAGVNDGIRQPGRSLVMWATGFQPQPWDKAAVFLLGNLLNYAGLVVGQQQNERLLVELIQVGVGRDKLQELFAPMLDEADFDLLAQVKIPSRLSDEALELLTDLPRLAGSNAWAISPQRSITGQALLASDPHLEINRLPAIWYEVVLAWGEGQYVLGATLPGCPLVAVGRNHELAWGVTYLKGDTSDYFIEDCRLEQMHWQYRRGDEWHDFDVREEKILRRTGPPQTLRVLSNPQGTIDADLDTAGPGYHLSVGWTGQWPGVGRSVGTWLKLLDLNNVRDAMDLVRESPQPSLNWVLADRQGHIGQQACGWFPLRPARYRGALPIPAWDPANHWQGRIPGEWLPSQYDPPEGFVATANESVNQPDRPPIVTQTVSDYRKRRIDQRLRELEQATVADCQALQYDVVSLQAQELMAVFLPHLPEGPLKERLAVWDFNYHPSSIEPTLFTRLYRNVLVELFGNDVSSGGGFGWRRILFLSTRVGFSLMVVTSIDQLLQREHSLWWSGRDKGAMVRRAAERITVIDEEVPWAVFNCFRFTNRFIENQFVGRLLGFHTAELPMPGCHATPFQGHLLRAATRETTFAPSYHFVTDLGTDLAWTNLPGGPSESWLSGFYQTDIPLWCEGRYKALVGR